MLTRREAERIIQLCTAALATEVPLSAMVDSHLHIIRSIVQDALRKELS